MVEPPPQPQEESAPITRSSQGDFFTFTMRGDQARCAAGDEKNNAGFEMLTQGEYRLLFSGGVVTPAPCAEITIDVQKEEAVLKLPLVPVPIPTQLCIQYLGIVSFSGVIDLTKLIQAYGPTIDTVQLIYNGEILSELSGILPKRPNAGPKQ